MINILIIEDNNIDVKIISKICYDVLTNINVNNIKTKPQLSMLLENIDKFDLIIVDYNLNTIDEFNGFDAVKYIRQYNIDIPIIITSGFIGDQNTIEIMKMGASDYILKDDLHKKLPITIKREIEIYTIKSQQQKLLSNVYTILLDIIFDDSNTCLLKDTCIEKILSYFYDSLNIKQILVFKLEDNIYKLRYEYPNFGNSYVIKNKINFNTNNISINSSNLYSDNINSIISHPIFIDKHNLYGILVFECLTSEKVWAMSETYILKVLAVLITLINAKIKKHEDRDQKNEHTKLKFIDIVRKQSEQILQLKDISSDINKIKT